MLPQFQKNDLVRFLYHKDYYKHGFVVGVQFPHTDINQSQHFNYLIFAINGQTWLVKESNIIQLAAAKKSLDNFVGL